MAEAGSDKEKPSLEQQIRELFSERSLKIREAEHFVGDKNTELRIEANSRLKEIVQLTGQAIADADSSQREELFEKLLRAFNAPKQQIGTREGDTFTTPVLFKALEIKDGQS